MGLEMENLRNEILLAKEENNSLKAERKYREIFMLLSLVICVIVGKYFGSVREMEQQTTMQVQAQNIELLRQNIDELKRQIRRVNIDSKETNLETQTCASGDWPSREMNETIELVIQIKQELAGLKNDSQLAKVEVNSLQAELGKYRIFLFLFFLIICGVVVMCFKLVRNINRQANRLGDVQNWGEFLWPIDGWAAKSQSAKDGTCTVIFSDPFYSHKNGYKMRLSVSPHGYGTDRDTHLSVSFRLMRGPFDNILSWPFKCAVTLALVNQQTRIDHVSYTVTFASLPTSVNWNKPLTENNGGFCSSKLIELAALSTNRDLCRNDKLFIRCLVK